MLIAASRGTNHGADYEKWLFGVFIFFGMYIRDSPSLTRFEQRLGGEAGYEM
jgi:hypothetical protein